MGGFRSLLRSAMFTGAVAMAPLSLEAQAQQPTTKGAQCSAQTCCGADFAVLAVPYSPKGIRRSAGQRADAAADNKTLSIDITVRDGDEVRLSTLPPGGTFGGDPYVADGKLTDDERGKGRIYKTKLYVERKAPCGPRSQLVDLTVRENEPRKKSAAVAVVPAIIPAPAPAPVPASTPGVDNSAAIAGLQSQIDSLKNRKPDTTTVYDTVRVEAYCNCKTDLARNLILHGGLGPTWSKGWKNSGVDWKNKHEVKQEDAPQMGVVLGFDYNGGWDKEGRAHLTVGGEYFRTNGEAIILAPRRLTYERKEFSNLHIPITWFPTGRLLGLGGDFILTNRKVDEDFYAVDEDGNETLITRVPGEQVSYKAYGLAARIGDAEKNLSIGYMTQSREDDVENVKGLYLGATFQPGNFGGLPINGRALWFRGRGANVDKPDGNRGPFKDTQFMASLQVAPLAFFSEDGREDPGHWSRVLEIGGYYYDSNREGSGSQIKERLYVVTGGVRFALPTHIIK